MVPNDTSLPSQPTVTRIQLDYEDGSSDEIKLLQGGEFPVYDLQRKRPGEEVRSLSAHSYGAIAAILFHTATTTERIEYSLGDPKIRELLARLFASTPSEGEQEAGHRGDAG